MLDSGLEAHQYADQGHKKGNVTITLNEDESN
jgi:hypothetical protein